MINKKTAAALAFIASLSINAGFAADQQASTPAPAPIVSQPAAEEIKVAPQPAVADKQTVEKATEQQSQAQQAK
ncbi:MAG TPA: hypothetical protein V6C81_20845 [Planktothrix sp.]|jgi:hypothetical protein